MKRKDFLKLVAIAPAARFLRAVAPAEPYTSDVLENGTYYVSMDRAGRARTRKTLPPRREVIIGYIEVSL